MKYIKIVILVTIIVLGSRSGAYASTPVMSQSDLDEMVIIGKDTVSMIIPERNWGRYDRGLFNYLFIPKGQWAFGLTASYGEFNADDLQYLSILNDFDFNGKLYSINPSVSYFFRNNQSIGVRFSYSRGDADLASFVLDIEDDLNISIKNVGYYYDTYTASLFYRYYVGFNSLKRFAIFSEVAFEVGGGSSRFKRYYDDELRDTKTNITQASLNFNPGMCVFITDYLSFDISFGVFGIQLKKERQKTNDIDEGSRFSGSANFKFNVFNIGFGIGLHI